MVKLVNLISFEDQARQARAKGLSAFTADRPCYNGHYDRNRWGQCIQCRRLKQPMTAQQKIARIQYATKYRKTHPEIVAKRVRDWQKRNPERMKIIKQRYCDKQLSIHIDKDME